MNRSTKKSLLFLSFILPLFLLLIVYAAVGIEPCGKTTMVYADAKTQYISFFAFYQNVLKGNADPFYSFSKILGGSTAGLFAYYLASPLNLLLLLFPEEKLPLAIDCLILLKISLCGLTMAFYYEGRHRLQFKTLVFTTAYAFCGYNMAYCWSVMWLDAVIVLPLMVRGIEILYDNGKPFLYVFSLGISIISCFYTGYMLCLFSVLYYGYVIFDRKGYLNFRKHFIYFTASLLAGGVSAFLLLPGYKALSSGISLTPIKQLELFTYPAMLKLLRFFPWIENPDACILSGLFIVVFLFLILFVFSVLFFLKAKKYRTVPIALTLLLLLIWYFLVETEVHKWSGYTDRHIFIKFLIGYTPFWELFDGSPNVYVGSLAFFLSLCYFGNKAIPARTRFSGFLLLLFLIVSLSFNLVNVIWHGFEKNDCFNYRYSFLICFVLLAFADECFYHMEELQIRNMLICTCICILILIYNQLNPIWFWNMKYFWLSAGFISAGVFSAFLCRRYSKTGTACIMIVELSAILLTAGLSIKNQTMEQAASSEYFANVISSGREMLQEINKDDSGFYRVRKDGVLFNYNDPMLFNYAGCSHYSSSEGEGIIAFLKAVGLRGSSPFWVNGDLGESRALDCLLGVRYYFGDPLDGYEMLSDRLQRNVNALPLAFLASPESVNIPEFHESVPENINSIYSLLSGKPTEVFAPAGSADGTITVMNENLLYVQTDIPDFDGYVLACNDKEIREQKGLRDYKFLCLGKFRNGDRLKISFFDSTGQQLHWEYNEEIFFYEDDSVISQVAGQLLDDPVSIEMAGSSDIVLHFSSEEDHLLVLSLPDEPGWIPILDNSRVNQGSALGAFLAIPVNRGDHHLSLRFIPPGLMTGCCISAVSVLLLLTWMVIRQKNRKTVGTV